MITKCVRFITIISKHPNKNVTVIGRISDKGVQIETSLLLLLLLLFSHDFEERFFLSLHENRCPIYFKEYSIQPQDFTLLPLPALILLLNKLFSPLAAALNKTMMWSMKDIHIMDS